MDSFRLPPPSYHPKQTVLHQYECTELQSYLKNCEFKKIAENIDLFWMAFCKTVSEMQQTPQYSGNFSITIKTQENREYILIAGQNDFDCTIDKVSNAVEKLRVFFQSSFCLSTAMFFFPVFINSHYYFQKIVPFMEITDLFPNPKYAHEGIEKFIFEESIKPIISQFAKLLGMSCIISHHQQEIREKSFSGKRKIYHCEAITLQPLNSNSV